MTRMWVYVVGAVVIAVLAGVAWREFLLPTLQVACGYSAKVTCSAVFLTKRTPLSVYQQELSGLIAMVTSVPVVDETEKSVTTTALWGLTSKRAFYTGEAGRGCVLDAHGKKPDIVTTASSVEGFEEVYRLDMTRKWPIGDADASPSSRDDRINYELLEETLSAQFNATDIQTRAILVVYKGRIVAERYREGYTAESRLGGWSMTKSLTNALVGITIHRHSHPSDNTALSLHKKGLLREWREKGSPLNDITLDHLLRMASGLQWAEVYEGVSDATRMLFLEESAGTHAASKSAFEADPGEGYWYYSSGTTNILCRILREFYESLYLTQSHNKHNTPNALQFYWDFPRRELFSVIGMRSAVMETDPSGTFVGSSFCYAVARDWARFGLLFLQDGVWQREDGESLRVLPEGWVKYTTTPTKGSFRKYGAHWWLNTRTTAPEEDGGHDYVAKREREKNAKEERRSEKGKEAAPSWHRALPPDAYWASGFEDQFVVVVPSRDLVIVRLGMDRDQNALKHADLWGGIVQSFPSSS